MSDKARDPLKPSVALLSKLGSVVVHLEELTSGNGHEFDLGACRALWQDEEIQQWIKDMDVFLPVKRSKSDV